MIKCEGGNIPSFNDIVVIQINKLLDRLDLWVSTTLFSSTTIAS